MSVSVLASIPMVVGAGIDKSPFKGLNDILCVFNSEKFNLNCFSKRVFNLSTAILHLISKVASTIGAFF